MHTIKSVAHSAISIHPNDLRPIAGGPLAGETLAPADRFDTGAAPEASSARSEPFPEADWRGVEDNGGDSEGGYPIYRVARGDTLTAIAKRLGSDVDSLARLNPLANPNRLKIGQPLELPTAFHVVKDGETYASVAKQTRIDSRVLAGINPEQPGSPAPGTEIRVPAAVTSPQMAQTRRALIGLVEDMAAAESALLYGPGSFRPYAVGNTFGWGDGGEEGFASFSMSDGYTEVRRAPLYKTEEVPSPVEDMRHSLVQQLASDVIWAQWAKLRDADPELQKPLEPKELGDGRVELGYFDAANRPASIIYDPKNDSLSAGLGGTWVSSVPRPTAALVELTGYLGMTYPAFPSERSIAPHG